MDDVEALAKLSRAAEAGYDMFASPHMMLRRWNREEWPAGTPRHGEALRVRVDLPQAYTPDDLAGLGGVDRLGLALAEQVTQRIFGVRAATLTSTALSDVDITVRRAIGICLGVGEHVGIWMNFDDERYPRGDFASPWDGMEVEPAYGYWGRWHRQPVFQTNFVPEGEIWVLGDRSTHLSVYPDQDGAGRVIVALDHTRQRLEARLWCELHARDTRALHRIALA